MTNPDLRRFRGHVGNAIKLTRVYLQKRNPRLCKEFIARFRAIDGNAPDAFEQLKQVRAAFYEARNRHLRRELCTEIGVSVLLQDKQKQAVLARLGKLDLTSPHFNFRLLAERNHFLNEEDGGKRPTDPRELYDLYIKEATSGSKPSYDWKG